MPRTKKDAAPKRKAAVRKPTCGGERQRKGEGEAREGFEEERELGWLQPHRR